RRAHRVFGQSHCSEPLALGSGISSLRPSVSSTDTRAPSALRAARTRDDEILRGDALAEQASAPSVPAAWPSAIAVAIWRAAPFACRVAEIALPVTMRPSRPIGSMQASGISKGAGGIDKRTPTL